MRAEAPCEARCTQLFPAGRGLNSQVLGSHRFVRGSSQAAAAQDKITIFPPPPPPPRQ